MPASGVSRREENKAIREEDWRERIRGSGALTQVIDNIGKMQVLADMSEIPKAVSEASDYIAPSTQIHNLQMTNNQSWKLIDKVLPDLKAMEIGISDRSEHMELDYEGFVVSEQ